jgi:hypothetical protein
MQVLEPVGAASTGKTPVLPVKSRHRPDFSGCRTVYQIDQIDPLYIIHIIKDISLHIKVLAALGANTPVTLTLFIKHRSRQPEMPWSLVYRLRGIGVCVGQGRLFLRRWLFFSMTSRLESGP